MIDDEVRLNEISDSAALRDELKAAIMELPTEDSYELLKEYAEKYGIKLFRCC